MYKELGTSIKLKNVLTRANWMHMFSLLDYFMSLNTSVGEIWSSNFNYSKLLLYKKLLCSKLEAVVHISVHRIEISEFLFLSDTECPSTIGNLQCTQSQNSQNCD